MKRPRHLSAQEHALWAHVTRSVRAMRAERSASADDRKGTTSPVLAQAQPLPVQPAPAPGAPARPPKVDRAALLALTQQQSPRPIPRTGSAKPARGWEMASPASTLADRKHDRRVRRGQLLPQARIDLHCHTQASARSALMAFVVRERLLGARCVLVVTGKSSSADDAPWPGPEPRGVIRRRVPEWLSEPEFRVHVAGLASAHRRHGGEGAYYLFLKSAGHAGQAPKD